MPILLARSLGVQEVVWSLFSVNYFSPRIVAAALSTNKEKAAAPTLGNDPLANQLPLRTRS